MMLDIILKMWYLWVLILLAAVYRLFKPSIKGWLGEKTVSMYLERLPKEDYLILSDLIFSTVTGTTQIDHVVVSLYGIFIIEVKTIKAGFLEARNPRSGRRTSMARKAAS